MPKPSLLLRLQVHPKDNMTYGSGTGPSGNINSLYSGDYTKLLYTLFQYAHTYLPLCVHISMCSLPSSLLTRIIPPPKIIPFLCPVARPFSFYHLPCNPNPNPCTLSRGKLLPHSLLYFLPLTFWFYVILKYMIGILLRYFDNHYFF